MIFTTKNSPKLEKPMRDASKKRTRIKKAPWPGADGRRYCLCGSTNILYADKESAYCDLCMPIEKSSGKKTRVEKNLQIGTIQ
jgi:hypothetical protein